MACPHQDDVKLKSSYDNSHVVCVVCLVEHLTDKTKHVAERYECGESCLSLLKQPISMYLVEEGAYATLLMNVISALLNHITIDQSLITTILSPLRSVLDTEEYDLRGKCNALILLADVIEKHEIVSNNAPHMIFECVLSQLNGGSQNLQGSAVYCLGVLLKHMDCLNFASVSNCCDALLGILCDPHDDVTVDQNAFECIRLVLKFPKSLNCVITNPKFLKVLRVSLSSHRPNLRCATLSFLMMLLSDEQNENIALYLHEVGILEFVYDCLSSNLDVARNALAFLRLLTSSTIFMSKNAVSYVLEKILTAKVEKKDEQIYRRKSMPVLEQIFRAYTGSVDLFCSLSTIENFFVVIHAELTDLGSSFSQTSRCFCSFLRSKQLCRPFPIQLFTDCVTAYGDRLKQPMCQLKSAIGSILDIFSFSSASLNEVQRKIENDTLELLALAISVQIHLGHVLLFLSDDFAGDESNQTLLAAFSRALNSLYFLLPLELIWKMFSCERTPAEILQGMLILTRRVLKKGFQHAEFIECGATCWSKSTTQPYALIDTNIRTVFRITIPLIIDNLMRAKNPTNFPVEQSCPSIRDGMIRTLLDPFDSQTFLLNFIQLSAYVIATGCVSFSDDALETADHSFFPECEKFWSLILDGVPRVPGCSVETVALLLDDLCGQAIEDSESDAGKLLPIAIIIAASLIHWTEVSVTDCNSLENYERIANLLSGLHKCVLRAGLRRFQDLPSLFAFECLTTFATVKRIGLQWTSVCTQVSSLLIETLLHRMSPLQTILLLKVQGFSELLLLGEPAWTTLAQKITYHCHSQERMTSRDLIGRLPVNYEFLSIIWSVWFPLLRDLDQQNVVRRLSETFENNYTSLERSRLALDTEVALEGSEKSSQPVGAERLASFVAEQLVTLPAKLEVPVSTLFFKFDVFRVNLLRMLALVVRLNNLFVNRTCLNRFVEIVVCLLTDSRCEASGNLLDLLKVLNTCLLMTDEIGLSQVTPYIVERVCATKAPWMYAQRSTIKTKNCLLLEEVCVLGTLLMFGEGPSGLYMNITPFKTSDARVYCPIFTIPDVLLSAIRGEAPAAVSHRSCCSATLLLLHAPRGLQMGPWPSHEESPNCTFYLQLLTSLYSNLMDATLKPFWFILSSLFGRTLNQGSEEMIREGAPKEGPLFGDSVWNSIIIENFQLEEFNKENLPCSSFLLAFLAELLENTPGLVITDVDEKLLQELVIFYAQQSANSVPPEDPYAYLQKIVDNPAPRCFAVWKTEVPAQPRTPLRQLVHITWVEITEIPSVGASTATDSTR